MIAHCSSPATPTIEPTEIGPTATPGPPGSPAPPPTISVAGTYNSNFTKTRDDGCHFRPTFSGPIVVTLDPNTLRIETRVIPFTLSGNNFNGQGTTTVGSLTIVSTVSGQFSGNNSRINGSVELNITAGCPGTPPRIVIYTFNGTK
jgi:hypothetical protein